MSFYKKSQLQIDNRDIYCWWCFISCVNKNLLQHELYALQKVFFNVYFPFLGGNAFLKSSALGALIDCWLWRIINDSTNSENCRVKNWIFENVYISIIFEGGFHINLFRSSKAYKVIQSRKACVQKDNWDNLHFTFVALNKFNNKVSLDI